MLRDPRGKMRADVQLSTPAHSAGVASLACRGDTVVTCGYTTDRVGQTVVDTFVKVVDVRVGARVLNVLQFHAGPAAVAFNPKYTSTAILASANGVVQTQVVDAGGRGGSGFQNHMLQLDGYHLAALDVSRSGETVAFGDSRGLVHLWSVNDTPRVNLFSNPVEVPPHRPACVERFFHYGPAEGLSDERGPLGPPPFQLAADPSAQPLSYEDPSATVTVGQCPRVVPEEVLKTVRQVDFVGRGDDKEGGGGN